MYSEIALLALSAAVAHAAPAPQSGPGVTCNPPYPPGPGAAFQLAAWDPVALASTPLSITEVSRGAKILAEAPSDSIPTLFTFDSANGAICSNTFGCDDGATTNPLLFGSPGPSTSSPYVQFAMLEGDGCFDKPYQTPYFAVPDPSDGTTPENDWNGFVLCGEQGIYWSGSDAAPSGCAKVGLQFFNQTPT